MRLSLTKKKSQLQNWQWQCISSSFSTKDYSTISTLLFSILFTFFPLSLLLPNKKKKMFTNKYFVFAPFLFSLEQMHTFHIYAENKLTHIIVRVTQTALISLDLHLKRVRIDIYLDWCMQFCFDNKRKGAFVSFLIYFHRLLPNSLKKLMCYF